MLPKTSCMSSWTQSWQLPHCAPSGAVWEPQGVPALSFKGHRSVNNWLGAPQQKTICIPGQWMVWYNPQLFLRLAHTCQSEDTVHLSFLSPQASIDLESAVLSWLGRERLPYLQLRYGCLNTELLTPLRPSVVLALATRSLIRAFKGESQWVTVAG